MPFSLKCFFYNNKIWFIKLKYFDSQKTTTKRLAKSFSIPKKRCQCKQWSGKNLINWASMLCSLDDVSQSKKVPNKVCMLLRHESVDIGRPFTLLTSGVWISQGPDIHIWDQTMTCSSGPISSVLHLQYPLSNYCPMINIIFPAWTGQLLMAICINVECWKYHISWW